jgi:hypothetical protein
MAECLGNYSMSRAIPHPCGAVPLPSAARKRFFPLSWVTSSAIRKVKTDLAGGESKWTRHVPVVLLIRLSFSDD